MRKILDTTEFVASSPWRDRVTLSHEPELLGTAGSIKANKHFHKGETLFVGHADNLTELDLAAFIQAHETRPHGAALTMLTFRTDKPHQSGIVELDDDGIVRAFHEKVQNPPGDLANAAAYILTPELLQDIGSREEPFIDFSTEVIPGLIGRIFAAPTDGYHRGIETVDCLRQAEREFPQG